MNFKQKVSNMSKKVAKHSPAILTGAGVVGLGATAYLAYKSRDKVEEVVIEIERKRELEIEINKVDVAKDIAEAIALPVSVGAVSVASILFAYRIQNNRIATLASALAAQQARNLYFENKYKKLHGEEAYEKFSTPTQEEETLAFNKDGSPKLDKEGNQKKSVKEVKKDIDKTIGQWYDESSEYASDDHTYNVAYIDNVNERMQTLLFQRGSLMLNEVREALGLERIRNGALLGWTVEDSFDIVKKVTNIVNEETGEFDTEIWVTWTTPRYVYGEVEFNGRYSIY